MPYNRYLSYSKIYKIYSWQSNIIKSKPISFPKKNLKCDWRCPTITGFGEGGLEEHIWICQPEREEIYIWDKVCKRPDAGMENGAHTQEKFLNGPMCSRLGWEIDVEVPWRVPASCSCIPVITVFKQLHASLLDSNNRIIPHRACCALNAVLTKTCWTACKCD